MLFPIIYKRTATGAIQQWQQEIDDNHPGQYRTISGQVDGKLVTSEWKQVEQKNVGKANETSLKDQAEFEVKANYKKKLDIDYHENIKDIDKPKIFECMLAKDYDDYKKKLVFPLFSQPKLDGMRCIAKADGLWSRNGKPIVSCPHIIEALQPLFDKDPDLILDGELYNHEYKEDFNSIISSAKKQKPNAEELAVSAELIEYHVYDVPSLDDKFRDRAVFVDEMLSRLNHPKIQIVNTSEVASFTELDKLYEGYADDGFEGQMVRVNAEYENKRTSNLLKRKEFQDAEYILVDILEGKGNWKGKAKRAILKTKDGTEFGAGIKGTREFCAKLLAEKHDYLGTWTSVNFFNLTPDGIPRFGRCKEFNRIDK